MSLKSELDRPMYRFLVPWDRANLCTGERLIGRREAGMSVPGGLLRRRRPYSPSIPHATLTNSRAQLMTRDTHV